MTSKLEDALKQLSAEDITRVESFADRLVQNSKTGRHHFKLDWAGKLDVPERGGLESQREAMRLWMESIEKNLT